MPPATISTSCMNLAGISAPKQGQGRAGATKPDGWAPSFIAPLQPASLHQPALPPEPGSPPQKTNPAKSQGRQQRNERVTQHHGACSSPRQKEEAQGSGQLQLYKVTQIFYLETAKPILVSSISINNPVGCCYLAYKQRGVCKAQASPGESGQQRSLG